MNVPNIMNNTMTNSNRHKDWRKIAKRERRRRIRTLKAKERDYLAPEEYEKWCKDQQALEFMELEQIEKSNQEENDKWLKAEQIALEQWKKIQLKKELLHQEKLQQQMKLKLEWEMEKERREKETERLKEIEEENRKRREVFMDNFNKYVDGDVAEPPKELLILYETKPNSEPCQFFTKTGCCRFGDECSRNHEYPGISKILLAANMFGHFGLQNSNFNEYDTDIMLEYEDSDTYKEFKDFFFDILPEFQKFGKVVELKVCNNYEKHLRGNTYIEYADVRSAVKAYRSLNSRWYGGKQLSLQFCNIKSWNIAVCGLQSSRRCPKGRACNFLHVFRNPIKLFEENRNSERPQRTPSRSWRWSESPDEKTPRYKDNEKYSSKDRERRRHRHKSHHSSCRKRDR